MGVLTQTMGTWDRPMAYLSKWLDSVATRWPGCWRAVAVVALLVREATKLTLGQDLIVKTPHEVNTLLRGDSHKWLSTFWITHCQRLLCEKPDVTIEPCQALNPATLLPVGEGGPSHDCKEILEIYASRPDLRDQPIPDPDWVLYTDGTSLVKQGQQLWGSAVVTEETIAEASSLPSHWSAQRAELYARIRALQLSKGKKTNIYRLQVCFCYFTCTWGFIESSSDSQWKGH